MVSGNDVYEEITKKLKDQERQHETLSQDIYNHEKEIDSLSEERETRLVELASHYLPELTSESVSSTLKDVRGEVKKIFESKQKRREQIESLMRSSEEKESALEKNLREITNKLDDVAETRDGVLKQIEENLKSDLEYISLHTTVTQEKEKLLRGESRVFESKYDANEKIPAFESSKLFMYLQKKGYGTDVYNGNGIIKKLDAWTSRVVNFSQNKANYEFLRSMPQMMEKEVEEQKSKLKPLETELTLMEDKVEAKYGLPKILSEGAVLGITREELMKQIQKLNQDQENYSQERKEMDSAKDPYHVEAVQKLKAYLKSEEIQDLKRKARQTPGTDDDKVCDRIEYIDGEVRRLKDEIKKSKTQRDEVAQKVSGLKRVESKYKSEDYESRRSYFPGDFDAGDLIDDYLNGKRTEAIIWKEIEDNQKFKPRETTTYRSPSYSSSSRRSSSSDNDSWGGGGFGGGGFSSGGGFGGGGFSSGGGFGGGGFSSGGGF